MKSIHQIDENHAGDGKDHEDRLNAPYLLFQENAGDDQRQNRYYRVDDTGFRRGDLRHSQRLKEEENDWIGDAVRQNFYEVCQPDGHAVPPEKGKYQNRQSRQRKPVRQQVEGTGASQRDLQRQKEKPVTRACKVIAI